VNNAGVFKSIPVEQISEEEFNRHFSINVLGTLLTTKESLSYFDESGGNIINMTSIVGEKAVPTYSIYSGTKGAIYSITNTLAAELAPRKYVLIQLHLELWIQKERINFNTATPGYIC
jgi:3-oxoacyl-[acyl-carrier protein] reductase